MKLNNIFSIAAVAGAMLMASCSEDSPITNPPVDNTPQEIDRTTFAKGADVSWLTQMESEGYTFYNSNREEMECMQLLCDECGVNSIRLRVWVNPVEGWNNIDDVLVKARRANDLGLRLMIDFHFSDTWADPANQATPAAWADLDIEGLKEAAAAHVTEMLSKLQHYGIEPEWVQIGNETRGGFMYPLGSISNPENFTGLVNAGYDAVKAIFPDAKVIIHLDSGNRLDLYTRVFGVLQANDGKYDMIGMSLYPDPTSWQSMVDALMANVETLYATYGKPVMICEVGMVYSEAAAANAMMTDLMSKSVASGHVEGIFYWEPQAPAGYNGGYDKGCFVDGAPTEALNCFKN